MKKLLKTIGLHILDVVATLINWGYIGAMVGTIAFVAFYFFVAFYGMTK